jgi:hypothetical protein
LNDKIFMPSFTQWEGSSRPGGQNILSLSVPTGSESRLTP